MKTKIKSPSWFNQKLETRKTSGAGIGVFVKQSIVKDEVLTVFGGYVMTIEEESKLPKKIRDYSLQISDNLVIGISKEEDIGPAEFFNHSCEPNAGFDGQVFLVAMRDIMPDEQVTFDYAMTIGGPDPYELKCMCGLKTCRKIVTNRDWKKKPLQRKYSGYFQWYLTKLIDGK
jgi:SET domain-containing protein